MSATDAYATDFDGIVRALAADGCEPRLTRDGDGTALLTWNDTDAYDGHTGRFVVRLFVGPAERSGPVTDVDTGGDPDEPKARDGQPVLYRRIHERFSNWTAP